MSEEKQGGNQEEIAPATPETVTEEALSTPDPVVETVQKTVESKPKKANFLFSRKKDKDAEKNGKWYTYAVGEIDDEEVTVRFKLRRLGGSNIKYLSEIEKRQSKFKHLAHANKGKLPDDIQYSISMDVFCKHVLVDWENVQDASGEFVPFSSDKAKEIFLELEDVYHELVVVAQSEKQYLLENREEDAKN